MNLTGNRKNTIKRRALIAAYIFVLSLIQSGVGGFLKFGGVCALFLIPAVAAAAMFEGDVAGVFYGLFAGGLWDITARGNNFNALYLVIFGYVCGTLIITIMRNNFVTHLLLSGAGVVIYCTVYWLYHYVIAGLDRAVTVFLTFYLPEIILTAAVSPLIFLLMWKTDKKFRSDIYEG